MRSRIFLVLALLAIAAFFWMMYEMAVVASRGDSAPLYSIHRYDPYGSAALAELLRERGHAVAPLRRPKMGPSQRGVLIQVLPLPQSERSCIGGSCRPPRALTLDTASLREWIAQGNTVVQFARHETPLLRELGRQAPADSAAEKIEQYEQTGDAPEKSPGAVIQAAWTDEGRALGATAPLALCSPVRIGDAQAKHFTPLARNGGVVAARVDFGQGRLIFVGAPTPALNHGLAEGGNLEFILGIVGDHPVLFDEWSHGAGQERGIMALIAEMGYRPVLAQVAFVLLLFVWGTKGHRPRDLTAPPSPRPGSEQIETLGHLYRRIHTREQVCARVAQIVRRRICAALGCSHDRLGARLNALPVEEAARLRALLALAGEARTDRDFCRLLTESSVYLEEKKHVR